MQNGDVPCKNRDVLCRKRLDCMQEFLPAEIALLAFDDATCNGDVDHVKPMKKARDLVGFFSGSSQATAQLKKQQQQMESCRGKVAVGVVQDVVTRWWSTLSMLKRLVHLKPALAALKADGKISEGKWLTGQEWAICEEMMEVLEPLGLSQETLEGENCVTSSLVFLAIKGIANSLSNRANNRLLQEATRTASKNLLIEFKKHWNWSANDKFSAEVIRGDRTRQVGIHPALFVCCFLGPRAHNNLKRLSRRDIRESLQKGRAGHRPT